MEDAIALDEKHGASIYHPLPVVIVRGEGPWVWDDKGNRYLDMLSAYSAVNQGHCHPRIVKALTEQASRLTLCSRAFHNDQLGYFMKELTQMCGFQRALPMNSGAEAVETAVKAARKWGYVAKKIPLDQARIVVCEGNFHGRTSTIVGFSSELQYREKFGPYAPVFDMIPYGNMQALEAAIGPHTAGFLVEPIQGEAGIRMPPPGFLAAARRLCTERNVLFIADEIQTGFGRTGHLFAAEYDGIRPDVLVVGKALSGGVYPVSAVLSDDPVLGILVPGDHGSTFGGNPLACAVAREALRVIAEEKLVEKARSQGEYLMGRLRDIKSPRIKEIRGRGLLVGVELNGSGPVARPVCEKLMGMGVLAKETHDTVIRFAPPLVVERDALDMAVAALTKALA